MKPTLVFDLDDTLLQLTPAFLQYVAKNNKKHVQFSNIKGSLHVLLRMTEKEELDLWKEFMYQPTYLQVKPEKNLKRTLLNFKKKFRIIILTNRNKHFMKAAKQWLNKYLPNCYDKLISAHKPNGDLTPKGKICKKLKAAYLIDDEPNNLYSARENGISIIVFDQPWNQRVSSKIPRISKIKELMKLR